MLRSYLDHAATSPMPASVREAYSEALAIVGNPASVHAHGQDSGVYLEDARRRVAEALGAEPVEVTFTSGGTESINIALKGMLWHATAGNPDRNVIMLPRTEHHATLDAAMWVEARQGAELFWLPVTAEGVVTPEALEAAITEVGAHRVALVTVLLANNEVGSIADVRGLCAVAKRAGVPVHIDAVAALGQVPLHFDDWGAQLMSVSAHKIGGPVGVGALAIARDAKPEALLHGGSQQRGRSGTQDVAGAVAFAAALDYLGPVEAYAERLAEKRDRLIARVTEAVPEAVLRGSNPAGPDRLPGNAHFTFSGCQGDSLLFLLDTQGISVSVGSACQAGVQETSHVLLAMGLPEHEAIGSLRITISGDTTDEELDAFVQALPAAYEHARNAGLV